MLAWQTSRAPNGIRTRAAALKGRCPRPLDDGGSTELAVLPVAPAVGDAPKHRGQPVRSSKAFPGGRREASARPRPALVAVLLTSCLQDRLLLPLLGDDRPGHQVDQGAEDAEERQCGHDEDHPDRGHREAEVVCRARRRRPPASGPRACGQASCCAMSFISSMMPDGPPRPCPRSPGALYASGKDAAGEDPAMPRTTDPAAAVDLLRIDDELSRRGAAGPRHGPGLRRQADPARRRRLVRGRDRCPASWLPEVGKLGLLGMHLTGYGCAGMGADRLRRRLPGAGGRRLRPAQPGLGAGVAGHVPDLEVRHRRSRSRNGCPGWRPARRSAASG